MERELESEDEREDEACPICFEGIIYQGVIDSCPHTFCFECISVWKTTKSTCPLCRIVIGTVTKLKREDIIHPQRIPDNATIKNVKCKMCNRRFLAQDDMEVHLITSHKCRNCEEFFRSWRELKAHVIQEHTLQCALCQFKCRNNGQFVSHLNKEHFPCRSCHEVFDTAELRKKHSVSTHALHCDRCHKYFWNEFELVEHKWEHGVKCTHCSWLAKSSEEMQKHSEKSHNFRCEFQCVGVYVRKNLLIPHYNERHGYCAPCARPFVSQAAFATHRSAIHCCKHCPIELDSKKDMKAHVSLSHTFPCDQCQFVSSTADLLKIHVESHKIYCDHCSDKFSSKNEAELHHLKVHNFSCVYCLKVFPLEPQLWAHYSAKHTICSKCDFVYRDESAYQTHFDEIHALVSCFQCTEEMPKPALARHVAEPHPFRCQLCQLRFVTTSGHNSHLISSHACCHRCNDVYLKDAESLRLHTIREHSPYCRECNLAFASADELKNHLMIHHVKCPLCSERFLSENLALHISSKHGRDCPLCDAFVLDDEREYHFRRNHICPACSFRWCDRGRLTCSTCSRKPEPAPVTPATNQKEQGFCIIL